MDKYVNKSLKISLFVVVGVLFYFGSAQAVAPFGMEGYGFEEPTTEATENIEITENTISQPELVSESSGEILKQVQDDSLSEEVDDEVVEIQEKQVLGVQTTSPQPSPILGEGEFGEIQRLHLNSETIVKGYTVEVENEFKVGVIPGAVSVPVEVVIKRIDPTHIPVEQTVEKMSDIYEFDVRQQVSGGTESLGVLDKPVHIALKFDLETLNKKIIHFWNKPEQRWVPLKSNTNFYDGYVRATINLPYARVALFDKEDVWEGWASWYRQYDGHYAAATIFPRKTMLTVTNISGSPRDGKTVDLKVNDYGPDPTVFTSIDPLDTLKAKRLIDLNDDTYLHLAASLASGIMPVRVELLK